MRYRLPPAPPLAYFCLFVVCLLLFVSSVSCTQQDRANTLRVSLTALNTARDGFIDWDRHHQMQIVETSKTRDEAESALFAYRERRKPVIEGFEAAYRALAVAATQTDEPSLRGALAMSADLVDAVRRLIGGS